MICRFIIACASGALLLGSDAPTVTFDQLIDRHIDNDTNGYFITPSPGKKRRAWMLERARTLQGNAAAIVHALEHGGRRDSTRSAVVDSAAICKVLLVADQYERGGR